MTKNSRYDKKQHWDDYEDNHGEYVLLFQPQTLQKSGREMIYSVQ